MIQKSSIIMMAPDISLAYRYIKGILAKASPSITDIAPEDISINNIKENSIYICWLYKISNGNKHQSSLTPIRKNLIQLNLYI
jgi:hypothetical protein